jgi:hypothetical protein
MMGGVDARRLVASLAAALIVSAGPPAVAAGAADDVEVELVGFLGRLPDGGARPLPAEGTITRFEVPNEQGGARQVFMVEFTGRTELGPDTGRLRGGQLVILQGVLQGDRLRIVRIRDIDVAEYGGRVSLPGGPLALPVAVDRTVNVHLDGAPSLPVAFLLMPRTASRVGSLRDGQRVTLTVVNGWRLVVGIESSAR